MITVESLTRSYAGFTAVDNLSFTTKPGRVTGFLGPQRRRQLHHDARHGGSDRPDVRHCHHRRQRCRDDSSRRQLVGSAGPG